MSRRYRAHHAYRDYVDKHWGLHPTRVVDWRDPDFPDAMSEMGRLLEVHHVPTGMHVPAGKEKDAPGRKAINVPRQQVMGAYLAWDPHEAHQRLYILAPAKLRREWRRRFWHPRGRRWDLNTLARVAGGHHQGGYPAIEVQPIGVATHIAYLTDKKGDGISCYIHAFGEEGGQRAILGIDQQGRLWLAGGDYVVEDGGIAN